MLALLDSHPDIAAVPVETGVFHRIEDDSAVLAALAGWPQRYSLDPSARIVAEKTPLHIIHLDRILRLIPDARIIVMVRDGRDAALSAAVRIGNFKLAVKRWTKAIERGFPYRDDPRVHFVRLEELLRNPQRMLDETCRFLGLRFDDRMLRHHEVARRWWDTEIRPANPAAPLVGSNHKHNRNWQINQPLFYNGGRWRREMSAGQATIFKRFAGRSLESAGYVQPGEDWQVGERTLFFTAALGSYDQFGLPYAASVLWANEDAAVELIVDDVASFREKYRDAIDMLEQLLPGRTLAIRNGAEGIHPPTARFRLEPMTRRPFVYIGDVDFLVLDRDVTDRHLSMMAASGKPYSNEKRPNSNRLTGLHFTKWDAYYPIPSLPFKGADEAQLYRLVDARGLLPAPALGRPMHGIHMSPHRSAVIRGEARISWGVTPCRWRQYQELDRTPFWQAMRPTFDPSYRVLLEKLDKAGQAHFGDA